MLELIVFLLVAILITLLGWWGFVGYLIAGSLLVAVLVTALVRISAAPRHLLKSQREKKRLREQIAWREKSGYDTQVLKTHLRELDAKGVYKNPYD